MVCRNPSRTSRYLGTNHREVLCDGPDLMVVAPPLGVSRAGQVSGILQNLLDREPYRDQAAEDVAQEVHVLTRRRAFAQVLASAHVHADETAAVGLSDAVALPVPPVVAARERNGIGGRVAVGDLVAPTAPEHTERLAIARHQIWDEP